VRAPSISAVVTAYNAEEYVAQTLQAILSQSRPPEEVVVVNDGSTDGTRDELARFRGEIRVVNQSNHGHPHALNRGFGEARGDYLAKCDADDIWEPEKLRRQVEALAARPQIDIAFCAARVFGESAGRWGMPVDDGASAGILDRRSFGRAMYRANGVCPSSTLVRRGLYEQLGPFAEHLAAEDYDYWMRALRAGAVFHYDPAMLVRHRRHNGNVSSNQLAMKRADLYVRCRDAELIDDRALVQKVVAHDYFVLGWLLRDQGRPREARSAFVSSLRHRPTLRAFAWVLILSAPERHRRVLGDRAISLRRAGIRGIGMNDRHLVGARVRL
jgi:glycosyltransferase involved in cell wall biosynthesis